MTHLGFLLNVWPFVALAAAQLAIAASPGPAVLVLSRESLSGDRSAGLACAIGLVVGTAIWAVAALSGLQLLFAAAPWAYAALKFFGAAYLIWLALRIWRSADARVDHVSTAGPRSAGRAFQTGLATQLSNPKAAVYFGSVFVALTPSDAGAATLGAVLSVVVVVESAWYGALAYALSTARIKRAYIGAKGALDRVAAGLLGALGVSVALSR